MANAVSTKHTNNQLADSLNHLANAAILDKGTMATLTEHIKTLTKHNSALIEQNGILINTIANLTNTKAQAINNAPKNKQSYFDPNGYCWSHGYKVTRNHNSQNCSQQLPGHQQSSNSLDQ